MLNIFKRTLIALFVMGCSFTMLTPTVNAEETVDPITHSVSFTEEEIKSSEPVEKNIVVNGEEVTITLEDVPQIIPFDSQTVILGNGTYNKRFTHSTAVGSTISATFNFSINPYIVKMNSVRNGTYHSAIGTFIRDRHIVLNNVSETSNLPVQAIYEVDYTTHFGGTFLASLKASVYTTGSVTFTYYIL